MTLAEAVETVRGNRTADEGSLVVDTSSSSGEGNAVRVLRTAAGWGVVLLLAVLLWPANLGGFSGLTVVSGQSMEPTYSTGDVVITWRSGAYEVGDVLSYTVPADQPGGGGHVIHRVSAVEVTGGERVYTTLGDNNPAADQWALTDADVTGAAVLHVPGLGGLIGPAVLPYLLAAALGALATVLLWQGRSDDDETQADPEPEPAA